ncbi:TetR family transcriptional regulator, partial [Mycobacterium sp. ITM-2017-0098]
GKAIEERGADFSISDVARTVGVTRQTVYRYFSSTEALLVAAADGSVMPVMWAVSRSRKPSTAWTAAVTEAVATALEWLPRE